MHALKRVAGIASVIAIAAFVLSLGACRPPPAPPPPVPYKPSYTFSAATAQTKQDVTIAVINPVVKGNVYGADGAEMLKALPTALVDLVTAKGMRYRGPFGKLEEMTFPEKRESDLGLYAELEVNAGWEKSSVHYAEGATPYLIGEPLICDVNVMASGKVSFVVIEPMSNETLWRKTVPIELPPTVIQKIQDNVACGGQAHPAGRPLDGEFGNAYRRQLELAFVTMMKGIDRYMNAEEFALLKTQAAELKAKKAY